MHEELRERIKQMAVLVERDQMTSYTEQKLLELLRDCDAALTPFGHVCGQHNCFAPATYSHQWDNSPVNYACDVHAEQVRLLAGGLGRPNPLKSLRY